jgi:hypothetical protein
VLLMLAETTFAFAVMFEKFMEVPAQTIFTDRLVPGRPSTYGAIPMRYEGSYSSVTCEQ